MPEWPTLPAGAGYPLVDADTGEFLSDAVKDWLEDFLGGSGGDTGMTNVLDYGAVADWNGSSGTNNATAFAAAIAATTAGGTVMVPPGRYYFTSTIVIDRPINFTCGAGGYLDSATGTQLVFSTGTRGIEVTTAPALDPKKYRIGPFQITSRNTSSGSNVGIYISSGHGLIDGCTVESFGSHGIHIRAGVELGGGNANLMTLNDVRAYGNYGDGIKLEGTDSNACILVKCDVVANRGYGINLEKSSMTKVVAPHADQQYYGAPGAYRDNGVSNDWDWVYSELSAPFLIDTDSSHGRLRASLYGEPVINTSGFGYISWSIARGANNAFTRQVYRQLGTTGQKDWEFIPGQWNNGTFDLRQATDNLLAFTINPAVTLTTWFTSHVPLTPNAHDLGIQGNEWRNMYLAGYLDIKEGTGDNPAANTARLFAQDNGSGKTQLCVRFPSGAVQVISTEP